ncbi:hypothetical protein OIU85_008236 [Salix viminalis]|uniref:Uncharacterized protein n=1 Tax=Salix viminalis TaxID=40686 RepID=A0A9Q0NXK2_SALVM|nr:hypothetical protein OIU85_008236 [Salix viminalis]
MLEFSQQGKAVFCMLGHIRSEPRVFYLMTKQHQEALEPIPGEALGSFRSIMIGSRYCWRSFNAFVNGSFHWIVDIDDDYDRTNIIYSSNFESDQSTTYSVGIWFLVEFTAEPTCLVKGVPQFFAMAK